MKAIIIDDSNSIRLNLEIFLRTELNIDVIATFNNGLDFLNYPDSHLADIILMDISMPGLSGLETSKQFLRKNPNKKIVAITMYHDVAYLKELVEAGIKGCVFKDRIYKDIPKAINRVLHSDDLYYPEEILFD